MRRAITFTVAVLLSSGAAWAGADGGARSDGGAQTAAISPEIDTRLSRVDARLATLESSQASPSVLSIGIVALLACVFLVVRSRFDTQARQVEAIEKTAKANAEATASAAALLTKVLATSLAQQAPKSLEEAVARTNGDLTKLEAELKTTVTRVDTVLRLMAGKKS